MDFLYPLYGLLTPLSLQLCLNQQYLYRIDTQDGSKVITKNQFHLGMVAFRQLGRQCIRPKILPCFMCLFHSNILHSDWPIHKSFYIDNFNSTTKRLRCYEPYHVFLCRNESFHYSSNLQLDSIKIPRHCDFTSLNIREPWISLSIFI